MCRNESDASEIKLAVTTDGSHSIVGSSLARTEGQPAARGEFGCPKSGRSADNVMQVAGPKTFPGTAPGFKLEEMQMKKLLIALIASSVSATAAAAWNPFQAVETPADKAKQQIVKEAAVYPQEGATSGRAANKLAAERYTQPAFAAGSDAQKQEWVTTHYRYWQEGLRSGLAANKLAHERNMPPLLATTGQKQQAVALATEEHVGA